MSKHYITILWGEEPEPDAKPITYIFNTKNEGMAFLNGIWEGINGAWDGYEYHHHDKPKTFKNEEFNNWKGRR